jgi:hypothetical protein
MAIVVPIVPPVVVSGVIAVVTTGVLTMDPTVVVTPMPRCPSHLPVMIPVCRAVIETPIPDLYVYPTRIGEGRDKSTGEDNSRDEKSLFNHN